MIRRALLFVMMSLLASAAQGDQTPNNAMSDELQLYWSFFGQSDASIDVAATLDRHGPLVFTGRAGEHAYELYWNTATQGFDVYFANKGWIKDLTTSTDSGRPVFKGLLDENRRPTLSGFVDVGPRGRVIVQIDGPNAVPRRFVTGTDGSPTAEAKCVCFGTAQDKEDCSDDDCDVSEDCNGGDEGTAHCRWKYAEGGSEDPPVVP